MLTCYQLQGCCSVTQPDLWPPCGGWKGGGLAKRWIFFVGINNMNVVLAGNTHNLDSCSCCCLNFCSIITQSPSVDDLVDNGQSKQMIHWQLCVCVCVYVCWRMGSGVGECKAVTTCHIFSLHMHRQLSKFSSILLLPTQWWALHLECVQMYFNDFSRQQHLIWKQLIMIILFNQSWKEKDLHWLGSRWYFLCNSHTFSFQDMIYKNASQLSKHWQKR